MPGLRRALWCSDNAVIKYKVRLADGTECHLACWDCT